MKLSASYDSDFPTESIRFINMGVVTRSSDDAIQRGVVDVDAGVITRVESIDDNSPVLDDASGRHIIDLRDHWLAPGLINCHDHLFNKRVRQAIPGVSMGELRRRINGQSDSLLAIEALRNAGEQLYNGVIAVRDLGVRNGVAFAVRDAISSGYATGPTILSAGSPVTMTGGHFVAMSVEADGPDAVRHAVRRQIHEGADCIKLMASGGLTGLPKERPDRVQFTVEELRAGVEEAHKAGRQVAVHAQARQAIKNAIDAGADSVEHGFYLDADLAEEMRERHVSFVPTINVPWNAVRRSRIAGDDELADYIDANVVKFHREAVKIAADAGVQIGAGTDSPGVMAEELELLVECGLSPQDAYTSATIAAARICGIDDLVGSIEVGKSADFIVTTQNPQADVSTLRDIQWVFMKGQKVRQPHTES